MKVELPFHSVRMFIFSSYRVDPLLYYGSSIVDCGYSLSRAAYRYSATEEQREQEACTVLLLVLRSTITEERIVRYSDKEERTYRYRYCGFVC